jgi:hypothetical protein
MSGFLSILEKDGRLSYSFRNSAGSLALAALLVLLALPSLSRAQDDEKKKLPMIDKLSSNVSHQAFSGTIQSLDEKHNILNVNTVTGGNTEIFPVKKNTHVTTADGDKLKLQSLEPGTNVLIYFEQKGDKRTVQTIVVLAAGETEPKKHPPHS